MSFVNIGRNFNDLISGLSSLRRRAQLTGQPFSSRDITNVQDAYFGAAREAAPAQASLGLQQQALEQQGTQFGQQLAETKRQAEEQARLQERQNLTAQEQMDQARRLGLANTVIQGTGAGLFGYHLLKPGADAAGSLVPTFMGGPGTPYFVADATLAPGAAAPAATPWWSGASGTLGPASAAAAMYLGSRVAGNLLDETKEVPKEAITTLKYPLTGAGSVLGGTLSDVTGIKELAEPTNFLMSVEDKVQNVVESAIDYINPFGGGCIIVTAATDRDSPEVNTARTYRDRYMDPLELRGYYMIAEKVAPLMNRWPWFKRLIKRQLVDKIIDYCQYATGRRETLPALWSSFVMKAFLGLCGFVGSFRDRYVRINGEVF